MDANLSPSHPWQLPPPQTDALEVSGVPVHLAGIAFGVAILAYSLVNAIEIAVVGANRIRIRHLMEQGSRSAAALYRLQQAKERFFTLIVVLQNLSVVVASTAGSFIAAQAVGGVWGLALGTGVMTVGLAMLGEVLPKVLAAHAGDRFPLLMARPVAALLWLLRPIVVPLAAAPAFISRLLLGQRMGVTPTVTEAELRTLIDIAAEEEAVEERQAELLERVFRFGERRVREVMVPRTEVVWLERGTTVRQFYSIFVDRPHSRFPVYEGSVDNVVGIVNIKDVLKGLAQEELSPDSPIDWCMRPALFVPESKRVGDLFWEMQRSGQQMAVVVDEFGGTAGVVTLEMLLEELVGVVSDELRPAQQEFVTVDERTYRLDGGMSIDDANQELGLDLPEGDYETVAGFVLDHLGHVPRQGEQFVYNGLRITVTRMSGRKIEEVTVTKLGTTPGQEGSP
jgi:CBS domain containing-hemolysin-like protein